MRGPEDSFRVTITYVDQPGPSGGYFYRWLSYDDPLPLLEVGEVYELVKVEVEE